jgi:hypothetical protein
MDLHFGSSRANVAPGVTRSLLEGNCGSEKFELRLRLGRADRTEVDEAAGRLNFNVVGVSRNHAEIVLTCGDGLPSTCRVADLGSTNGTFLIRPAPSHSVGGNSGASAESDDEASTGELTFRRPGTSSGELLERRVDSRFSSETSGIPYLRLGPKLCLGLSLLRSSNTDFNLRDVHVLTEKFFSASQLRSLGWEDACLDHVLADKRNKERVQAMLDKFAKESRAVVRRVVPESSQQQRNPSVSSQIAPSSVHVPRDALACSPVYTGRNEEQHIFLSYQWDCQSIVVAVSEDLKARGYKVWLDLEKMHGGMNQRMAEAVEGAAVVCPFISRRYKASANCMKELNYSDQLGKPMVPIIVDDFDVKEMLRGAVGLITSNLIYVDLSRFAKTSCTDPPASIPDENLTALFEAKMSEMERVLGPRGKTEAGPTIDSRLATKCGHQELDGQEQRDAARSSLGGAKALPSLPTIV